MLRTLDWLLGHERLTVPETARVLVLDKGRFSAILGPGEHRLRRRGVTAELHQLGKAEFASAYADALLRERPDLAAAHLTEVRTGTGELAVIRRDGMVARILRPSQRVLLWTDAGPWTVERHDVSGDLTIGAELGREVAAAPGQKFTVRAFTVPDGHVGVLRDEGAVAGTLGPGTHRFWAVRALEMKLVDLRWLSHDVTGQEVLTRDRVTIRVNLSVAYRVTDPVLAVTAVGDFAEALHRAVQFAFRRTLGALTLDALLAEKVGVDAEAAAAVRAEMAQAGVEVGEIALKDVILPGEMRTILNRVVEAQKEAEANVIRRREETNATRSLLNTAKVMAENPVMLRLKELEALESVAGKVERLVVLNGTEGLLENVVKLR